MSCRIEPDASVEPAVRRMAVEQIDKAVGELTADHLDRHEGVHQARKRFKKIRAVVRLARGSPGGTYSAENAWFRDIERELSAARPLGRRIHAEKPKRFVARIEAYWKARTGGSSPVPVTGSAAASGAPS
jgi:hypothetical protein